MFPMRYHALNDQRPEKLLESAIGSLFLKKPTAERSARARRSACRFQVEPLEGRALLSAVHAAPGVGPVEVAHSAASERAQMHQLSFLSGNWAAINSNADGTTVLGRRSYQYVHARTELAYTETALTIPGYVGHSVLAVDPSTGLITERGSDSQGGSWEWTWVKIAPRTFLLEGSTTTSEGVSTPIRYTLTQNGNNTYMFIQESFRDGAYQFDASALRIRINGGKR